MRKSCKQVTNDAYPMSFEEVSYSYIDFLKLFQILNLLVALFRKKPDIIKLSLNLKKGKN